MRLWGMEPNEIGYGKARSVDDLRTGELVAKIVGELSMPLFVGECIETDVTLPRLPSLAERELEEYLPGLSREQFERLMAGIELGRRVHEAKTRSWRPADRISGTESAKRYCEEAFGRLATDSAREEFHIVTLNTKNCVLRTHQISIGTLDASLVHPREVFRPAIRDAAASILLVHNHPSGDPTPSKEDLAVTRRLEDVGKTLGIDVLDHIVVSSGGAISLRETR